MVARTAEGQYSYSKRMLSLRNRRELQLSLSGVEVDNCVVEVEGRTGLLRLKMGLGLSLRMYNTRLIELYWGQGI